MRGSDRLVHHSLIVPQADKLFDCEQAAMTPTGSIFPESRHF
jgi:hypothetical protein